MFQALVFALCFAPLAAFSLQVLGFPIDWIKLTAGVFAGVVVGLVVGAVLGKTFGMPVGVADSVVGCAAAAIAFGIALGVAGGTPLSGMYLDGSPPIGPVAARVVARSSRRDATILFTLGLAAVALLYVIFNRIISVAAIKLRAREIGRLAKAKEFQAVQELRGHWLPGLQGADNLLLGFSDAARFLVAAQSSFGAYHRLNHLRGFTQKTKELETLLRVTRSRLTQPFEESLRTLREAGDQMRIEAERDAAGLLPNPFRPGDAITSESGRELFRGRETAIRDIENALSDASRSLSLQLLAPRRSGKTSLLKMLPDMVPDAVCVFFDLQANPADSLASFWKNLATKAIIQAKLQRRVELPTLPDGPPMEAANAWLEKLDGLPNGRRVLIAIDEFERLETLFPFSKHELLQIMGLLRATIQHRRNVRLLVSGAAPFDELDRIWDDHFINTRQIKLPFLDQPTSIELLIRPSADFPAGTIPHEVALEVFRQTGGQPFLLQIFGYLLVEQLNVDKRRVASLADLAAIQTRAIEWAEPYFRDMHKDAPPETRDALARLSRGDILNLDPRTKRWLAQRYLLMADGSFAIPLFASWIENYAIA